jgi:excisionase family DNA binding protein
MKDKLPEKPGILSAHSNMEWGKQSLLTKQQAANYIGCSQRYLERVIVSGRLRALKPTSKLLRIRLKDLEAFMDSGATIGGRVQ